MAMRIRIMMRIYGQNNDKKMKIKLYKNKNNKKYKDNNETNEVNN